MINEGREFLIRLAFAVCRPERVNTYCIHHRVHAGRLTENLPNQTNNTRRVVVEEKYNEQ
jgi:hypothetical protein